MFYFLVIGCVLLPHITELFKVLNNQFAYLYFMTFNYLQTERYHIGTYQHNKNVVVLTNIVMM